MNTPVFLSIKLPIVSLLFGSFSKGAVVCPTLAVSPVQPTICAGKSVTLTATGAANYTWTQNGSGPQYSASIVVSPTNSAVYKVTGDDGLGCKDSAQVVVVVNPAPNVNATSNKTL